MDTERRCWPSEDEVNGIREIVSAMSGRSLEAVRVVVSPYRICPLGAHIDHQGGMVSAMTINKGVLLGFVPSGDAQVILRSAQFNGEVRFSTDEVQYPRPIRKKNEKHATDSPKLREDSNWGNFARGALYALQSSGYSITQGITGYISGSEGFDSSGLSSSAAVGVAYLLALESANNLIIPPTVNIEYDRLIENEYFGLRNGILDQSAILLSSHGCLTCMNCKTKEHKLIRPSKLLKPYKILVAFSGLRDALTNNPGYNSRVAECQEAARFLLKASGNDNVEPFLCNVEPEAYQMYKCKLEPILAKRAEHFFSENMRVIKGFEAWASGNIEEFGRLISASGLSSIENYECGCEPLINLYEILLRAPGIFGARFSGAGFRGCCVAFVDANFAEEAASFVRDEYFKAQPKLASQVNPGSLVTICEADDSARTFAEAKLLRDQYMTAISVSASASARDRQQVSGKFLDGSCSLVVCSSALAAEAMAVRTAMERVQSQNFQDIILESDSLEVITRLTIPKATAAGAFNLLLLIFSFLSKLLVQSFLPLFLGKGINLLTGFQKTHL